MLFVGTVKTSREELRQAIPLLIALFVGIVGLYAIVFLMSRFLFATRVSTSALTALTASSPAVPFMGPAILGYLFGQSSAIPIAIGSLVVNLTVVPADDPLPHDGPGRAKARTKESAPEGAKDWLPRASGLSTMLRNSGRRFASLHGLGAAGRTRGGADRLARSCARPFSRSRCWDTQPAASACSRLESCSPP